MGVRFVRRIVVNPPIHPTPSLRSLPSGHTLIEAGQRGPVWRVITGVLRLERSGQDGQMLVQLALPGDLIGVEALCAQPHAYSVSALINAEVEPVMINGELGHYALLTKGLLQQQRQTLDMMRLRSGPIQQRLAYLLTVLGKGSDDRLRPVQRDELPTLRQMAQIVDSALETVCRELNVLLPRQLAARKPIKAAPAAAPAKQRSRWVRPVAPAMALAA